MPNDSTIPVTKGTEQAKLLEAWRISMAQIPLPKKGSFEASYPSKEWREVPSAKARPYPLLPRRSLRPGAYRVHFLGDRFFCQRHWRDEREWAEWRDRAGGG